MISAALFTTEHNTVMPQVVEKFRLKQGEDTGVFPKLGQMTLRRLTEGEDIVDTEDIGMTTVSVQTSEAGGKVILTDRLLRTNVAANFRTTGRQLGDAAARIMDEDGVALFPGLNGGTDYGLAARVFSASNAVGAIGFAKHNKMGGDLRIVHHPSAILRLSRDLNVIGLAQTNQYPIPAGFTASKLQKFWTGIRLGGVSFFETGNIPIDGDGDAIGGIFDRSALGYLESKGWGRERQRDATLRAWELVIVADYAFFEHDDTRGAPLTFDAAAPVST
jgi:hypothetical protein